MSREDFEDLKEFTKQMHSERVSKTPDRIEYAIERFDHYGFPYELKNYQIGHLHVWDMEGHRFQFYASTGKILGYENARGIDMLIKILNSGKGQTKQKV